MPADWSRRRWAARATLLLLLGVGFLALDAAPAAAHGLVGAQPTNYVSRILTVTPSIPGLHVEVRDLGNRIEVRNDTRYEVVVLGYSGEPYLRVGPNGVYENRRSPSVFLNRTATIVADAPPSYSATATPVWRHISGAHEVLWHDHRVHWMGTSEPPVVAQSPGEAHLVSDWFVTLQYRGQTVRVGGDLRWVPGPSAAPRLALALVVALLVAAIGFARWWGATIAVILLALAALVTVLVAGEWGATSGGAWIALLSTVYSLLGIGIAVAAAAALLRARRTPTDASAIVLVAAVVLCFGSGLADVTFLGHSQLPARLSGPLARTFVALVLGGSVGVLVTAAFHLRRPTLLTAEAAPPMRSPEPAPTDALP
jgi:hypothetical protein